MSLIGGQAPKQIFGDFVGIYSKVVLSYAFTSIARASREAGASSLCLGKTHKNHLL